MRLKVFATAFFLFYCCGMESNEDQKRKRKNNQIEGTEITTKLKNHRAFQCEFCDKPRFLSLKKNCGHKFCSTCVSNFLNKMCPICGESMPKFLNECRATYHRISDLNPQEGNAAAYFAVKQNLVDLLKLLAKKVDLDRANDKGRTPMFWAVAFGHFDIVKFLATLNVNLNRADHEGHNLVGLAAKLNHLEIIKFLATKHVDLDQADSYMETPIYIAAYRGHTEIVKFLIEKKVTLLDYLLSIMRTTQEIKQMISEGIQIKRKIFKAVLQGRLDVVENLAEKVSLNQFYEYIKETRLGVERKTLIYIAANEGHMKIVRYLAEQGVDLNRGLEKWSGHTPIFAAAREGHTQIVKFLIEKMVKLDKNLLKIAKTEDIKRLIDEELEKKKSNLLN